MVLPTLAPDYSRFIYSFLPRQYAHFIAPEARRKINEGISVEDVFAADVYSLSVVIASKLGASLESREELREVVTRGQSKYWEERPALSEVSAALRLACSLGPNC